jgi:hypothetical protein
LALITVMARGEDEGEAGEAPGAPGEAEVGGDEGVAKAVMAATSDSSDRQFRQK